MVLYICKKCDRHFNRKFLYKQHLNRKTDCRNTNIGGSKTNKKIEHKCEKCDKNFSSYG